MTLVPLAIQFNLKGQKASEDEPEAEGLNQHQDRLVYNDLRAIQCKFTSILLVYY
jgi:hypothetical protein